MWKSCNIFLLQVYFLSLGHCLLTVQQLENLLLDSDGTILLEGPSNVSSRINGINVTNLIADVKDESSIGLVDHELSLWETGRVVHDLVDDVYQKVCKVTELANRILLMLLRLTRSLLLAIFMMVGITTGNYLFV